MLGFSVTYTTQTGRSRFNIWSTADDVIGLVLIFGITFVVLSL